MSEHPQTKVLPRPQSRLALGDENIKIVGQRDGFSPAEDSHAIIKDLDQRTDSMIVESLTGAEDGDGLDFDRDEQKESETPPTKVKGMNVKQKDRTTVFQAQKPGAIPIARRGPLSKTRTAARTETKGRLQGKRRNLRGSDDTGKSKAQSVAFREELEEVRIIDKGNNVSFPASVATCRRGAVRAHVNNACNADIEIVAAPEQKAPDQVFGEDHVPERHEHLRLLCALNEMQEQELAKKFRSVNSMSIMKIKS
jgi:hypothetical protein